MPKFLKSMLNDALSAGIGVRNEEYCEQKHDDYENHYGYAPS